MGVSESKFFDIASELFTKKKAVKEDSHKLKDSVNKLKMVNKL